MRKCEEADADAPRPGCGCRECYRERERYLDPRLIRLCGVGTISSNARMVVHRVLEMYLVGHIEWAGLYTEIIERLVELDEKTFEQLMTLTKTQAPALFIMQKKE